jgi:hypothetical protein
LVFEPSLSVIFFRLLQIEICSLDESARRSIREKMQLWATGCVGTWFAICKRGPAGASDLLLVLGVWPGQSLRSPQPRTLFQALVYKSQLHIQ